MAPEDITISIQMHLAEKQTHYMQEFEIFNLVVKSIFGSSTPKGTGTIATSDLPVFNDPDQVRAFMARK